ncbi:tetratricopeptide repeat protein [Roseomonas sp. E05]|uniref:tetratricopeptide repeat protein n=1 Tax=Roseomonas sp. E05 TaxID=3046310 RepID=UPI0024B9D8A5|nr:tetratricopeptide repeat protein [Roseomonas sp. E05]MDJ0390416.1 tetratricopeptide repeat protein [Roseomonas sp. E05]
MPEPEIIAESPMLRAYFLQGRGDTLLLTFTGLGFDTTQLQRRQFAARSVAEKLGLPAIGVVAKEPNWFPQHEMALLTPAILRTSQNFRRVVAYGFSMGGYAALKYSRAFAADYVIAFSPQWSIDPAIAPWETSYVRYLRPFHKGMEIGPGDVSGSIYIVYDDLHADTKNANKIAEVAPVNRIVARHLGHATWDAMLSSAAMGRLIQHVIDGDVAAVRHFIRRRRRSVARFESTVWLARARHCLGKRRFQEAERAARRALDCPSPASGGKWVLGKILAGQGRLGEAEDMIRQNMALDPKAIWLHYHLAGVLEQQGRMREALQSLDAVLAANPADRASLVARERIMKRLAAGLPPPHGA